MERKFEQMIAEAGKAVETMRSEFEVEHVKNIAELRAAWNVAKSAGDQNCDLSDVFRISHDIKGQGGTFGRQILTDIAGLLCTLLSRFEKSVLTPKAIEAIECHVAALELATRRNIVGDGGAGSAKLVGGLKALAAAVRPAA